MNFNKIVNEIKGDITKGMKVTIPDSDKIWTVSDTEKDKEYFTLVTDDEDEAVKSVYNIDKIKKKPILGETNFKQQQKIVAQYENKISSINNEMGKFGNNSKKGKKYTDLQKELLKTETVLKIVK